MRAILRPHLGDKRQTTRQHMEKPWRQLEDSILGTTSRRQLRGHIYLGERWKTTKQQQEWETETTLQKPHLGDNWETASGKEVEDNETTTRPGANIWETKSREIGQRQLNNNRTGKQHLGTTSRRQLGDRIWERDGRQRNNYQTRSQYLGNQI